MAKDYRNKIIPNYIYFYHLDKFCVLPLYPESIQDSLQSTYKETNALSRSAPVFTYSNSGPRRVTISFDLHRDIMNDINKDISNLRDNVVPMEGDEDYIDTMIRYLTAAALPKYQDYSSTAKSIIPPMVAVRCGNTFFIKGVVNGSVNVTYNKPIMDNGKYAKINVQFSVCEMDPYDAEALTQVGSFRGLAAAGKDNNIYRG